jgi:hypothetical protein
MRRYAVFTNLGSSKGGPFGPPNVYSSPGNKIEIIDRKNRLIDTHPIGLSQDIRYTAIIQHKIRENETRYLTKARSSTPSSDWIFMDNSARTTEAEKTNIRRLW